MESSDSDGGSSVAVLTYLGRILDALDNVQMKHLMLQYLLAAPEGASETSETAPPSPKMLRRRQSLNLLARMDGADDQMNPSLFSLVDLLTSGLRSANPETCMAALRLITTILGKNHAYAIGSLIKVSLVHDNDVRRTHGALNAEIEAYLNLAKTIGHEGIDESYESTTKDASRLLESHACSARLLKLDELGFLPKQNGGKNSLPIPGPSKHHIDSEFGVFHYLTELVEAFLTNNIEVNLALTEVILTIASCGQLQLEGWLCVEPSRYVFSDTKVDLDASVASLSGSVQMPNEKEDAGPPSDQVSAVARARRRPNWYRKHNPQLLTALHKVHAELDSIKSSMPSLNTLFAARRQAFQLHDEITAAIANAPPPGPLNDMLSPPISQQATPAPTTDKRSWPERLLSDYDQSIGGTPSKASPSVRNKTPALAQRMLSDHDKGTPSRSARNRSQSPTKAPATSRGAQSRSPPASPRGKEPRALGSYGLIGSRTPQTPQSGSRAVSPRPNANLVDPSQQLLDDVVREANTDVLARRFTFPVKHPAEAKTDGESEGDTSREGDEVRGRSSREATLSHILTNAVILRDFELELVALMQIRASMFDEVKFA